MKKKSNTISNEFKVFLMEAECQTGKKLKIFQTDSGGEYFSTSFIQYLEGLGIIHEKTNPDTPQENGVSTLIELWLLLYEHSNA